MKFFAPGWMSKNYKRAMKSVGKLKDEDKLYKAALEAPLASVCVAAVEKQTDEGALSNIAKKAPYGDARKVAVERLIALHALTDPEKTDPEPDARKAVIKKLTEQTLLADAAKQARNDDTANSLWAIGGKIGLLEAKSIEKAIGSVTFYPIGMYDLQVSGLKTDSPQNKCFINQDGQTIELWASYCLDLAFFMEENGIAEVEMQP